MNSDERDKLILAVQEYTARKDRQRHPNGRFDKQGRWYPADNERQNCCQGLRSPSAKWPLSYQKHCRTVEHVANLYDVPLANLKRTAWIWKEFGSSLRLVIPKVFEDLLNRRNLKTAKLVAATTVRLLNIKPKKEDSEYGKSRTNTSSGSR